MSEMREGRWRIGKIQMGESERKKDQVQIKCTARLGNARNANQDQETIQDIQGTGAATTLTEYHSIPESNPSPEDDKVKDYQVRSRIRVIRVHQMWDTVWIKLRCCSLNTTLGRCHPPLVARKMPAAEVPL